MAFDMTKTKVGDKLLTRDGRVAELVYVNKHITYGYHIKLISSSKTYTVSAEGHEWRTDEAPEDITGFAYNHNNNPDEMKAVELLLSLGYTLKKGN